LDLSSVFLEFPVQHSSGIKVIHALPPLKIKNPDDVVTQFLQVRNKLFRIAASCPGESQSHFEEFLYIAPPRRRFMNAMRNTPFIQASYS
jgi:hypothetical protein